MGDERAAAYLVIGGAGGIGSATVKKLSDRGAKVAIASRRSDAVERFADEVGAEALTLDARDFDAVESCVHQAHEKLGGLTGVACLAGSIVLKPAHICTLQDLEDALQTNVHTAFATVRAAAKQLRDRGGSVVLMSSVAARTGLPNHEVIAAAKGAVEGLTRAAAATYAGQQLRVNAVAPGLVDTPLSSQITGNATALKASQAMHPLGRIGGPDEIAAVIDWLLSDASGWVTGQVMSVDGGLSTLHGKPKV